MSRDVGFTTRRIRQRKETYITGYRVHEQCVTHTQFTFVTHTRFELCETHVSRLEKMYQRPGYIFSSRGQLNLCACKWCRNTVEQVTHSAATWDCRQLRAWTAKIARYPRRVRTERLKNDVMSFVLKVRLPGPVLNCGFIVGRYHGAANSLQVSDSRFDNAVVCLHHPPWVGRRAHETKDL